MIPRNLVMLSLATLASGFVAPLRSDTQSCPAYAFGSLLGNAQRQPATFLRLGLDDGDEEPIERIGAQPWQQKVEGGLKAAFLAAALSLGIWTAPVAVPNAVAATDPGAIVGCLLSKCQVQFAKCITNPGCLANVICINSCNNKEDETGCQIKCGDIFDNAVIGDFNKCAVSDMSCVPQKPDEGLYPEPTHAQMVSQFNTKFFDGKLYITAGLNPLFDIFPCQVHFFTETSPGTFFGKLNWDIVEPDGELFTRDALQQFVQDPKESAHLINHDNEYLHYKDDWYILDCEYPGNKDGIPPFAFVYYRGSNDAWDGYGGAVVYTQASKLPPSLIPRLEAAAKKIGHSWSEFAVTDNSCVRPDEGEKLELRKRFLGDAVIQTEKQVQAQATRFRGNAANSIKAQKLFFNNQGGEAQKAYEFLRDQVVEFENDS